MNPIMAHRGWSSRAPENTLAAIQLAVEQPWIDCIELDIQLSKDGVPVVIHDFRLERTTNGSGYVAEKSLKELKELDAGTWFSPTFVNETIPTLEEVLQLTKGKKKLNLELKTAGGLYKGYEELVVQYVNSYRMQQEVFISSFDHERVLRVKHLAPNIETGLIIEGNPTLLQEQLDYVGANIISMSFLFLTEDFALKHISLGREIVVWTPNRVEEIQFVKKVSNQIVICTNYPERAK